MSYETVAYRMLLALVLGGLIGLEREHHNRPAGFRTHTLVCVGSALMMLVSIFVYEVYEDTASVDPGRIAAQVVSGIGFLGAGTIMREGISIRGLTTAASLWVSAGIGLAAGIGFYSAAVIFTLGALASLIILSRFEDLMVNKRNFRTLSVVIADRPGQVGSIGSILGKYGVNIRQISLKEISSGRVEVSLRIEHRSAVDLNKVIQELFEADGILAVEQN